MSFGKNTSPTGDGDFATVEVGSLSHCLRSLYTSSGPSTKDKTCMNVAAGYMIKCSSRFDAQDFLGVKTHGFKTTNFGSFVEGLKDLYLKARTVNANKM